MNDIEPMDDPYSHIRPLVDYLEFAWNFREGNKPTLWVLFREAHGTNVDLSIYKFQQYTKEIESESNPDDIKVLGMFGLTSFDTVLAMSEHPEFRKYMAAKLGLV